ncbi:MAG: M20/M25/M40 family metallo-hydrolase [Oscillospiraceae bacterium]|nr:M20/M25/M40 family metallo-hydrolase [Oscillospiraceae bacterium]
MPLDLIDILHTVCASPDAAVQLLSQYMPVTTDALGNVLGTRGLNDAQENAQDGLSFDRATTDHAAAPRLLLEAHLDTVGFILTQKDGDGPYKFANVGGADVRALPGARVTFAGHPGVISAVPPHLKKDDDKLDLDAMRVDLGGIDLPVGTRGGFASAFHSDGRRVIAPGLDDRAGVAAVLYALSLVPKEIPLMVCFAAQEELGTRGAGVAAFALQPTQALAVDVSFGDTPDAPVHKCGKLGEGPMVGISPALDKEMTDALLQLAGEHCQREVMAGKTGTDADALALAREGVATALVSIPLRYMHTPSETVDVEDVKAVGELLAAYAAQLHENGEAQ